MGKAQIKTGKVKKLININSRENMKLKRFCLNNGFNESYVIEQLIRHYLDNIKVVAEQPDENK